MKCLQANVKPLNTGKANLKSLPCTNAKRTKYWYVFLDKTHPQALGLKVDPTTISSSNKRCCHWKVKVIQGMIKQSKLSQKLKDTSSCQTTP